MKEFYVYVPILETIKVLLTNVHVNNQWKSRKQSSEGVFVDFMDGELYKTNEFFRLNPNALQVILYQDAFEVCNPLGSSRKLYKVVGIYMTLGNIQPWHRSKVDNIQLVALCLERDIKKYGFGKIVDILIKDLNDLETTGLQIQDKVVKGTLVAMLGDNLGSHQIGGFMENFNSEYFCRYCYAKKVEFNRNPTKIFSLRTKTLHDSDVMFAAVRGEITNGVKSDSILNKCKFFHVCAPGLPPCLAHDFAEGILACDFMLCINYLVSHKYLTYDLLNTQLQNVNLRYERKGEKIPKISKAIN